MLSNGDRVILAGLVGGLVLAILINCCFIIPSLINMHNDGALIGAGLLVIINPFVGYYGAHYIVRVANIMKDEK